MEFPRPTKRTQLFAANSIPNNQRVRTALRYALNNQSTKEQEVDRILKLPVQSNKRSRTTPSSMSAKITEGQSRAHAKITKAIVSDVSCFMI